MSEKAVPPRPSPEQEQKLIEKSKVPTWSDEPVLHQLSYVQGQRFVGLTKKEIDDWAVRATRALEDIALDQMDQADDDLDLVDLAIKALRMQNDEDLQPADLVPAHNITFLIAISMMVRSPHYAPYIYAPMALYALCYNANFPGMKTSVRNMMWSLESFAQGIEYRDKMENFFRGPVLDVIWDDRIFGCEGILHRYGLRVHPYIHPTQGDWVETVVETAATIYMGIYASAKEDKKKDTMEFRKFVSLFIELDNALQQLANSLQGTIKTEEEINTRLGRLSSSDTFTEIDNKIKQVLGDHLNHLDSDGNKALIHDTVKPDKDKQEWVGVRDPGVGNRSFKFRMAIKCVCENIFYLLPEDGMERLDDIKYMRGFSDQHFMHEMKDLIPQEVRQSSESISLLVHRLASFRLGADDKEKAVISRSMKVVKRIAKDFTEASIGTAFESAAPRWCKWRKWRNEKEESTEALLVRAPRYVQVKDEESSNQPTVHQIQLFERVDLLSQVKEGKAEKL